VNVTSVSHFVQFMHENIPRRNFALDPVNNTFDLSSDEYIQSLEFWALPALVVTVFFIVFALCYLCAKINTPDAKFALFRILTPDREAKVRLLTKSFMLVTSFLNTALSGFTLVASVYEFASANELKLASSGYVEATRTQSINVIETYEKAYDGKYTNINATTIDTSVLGLVLESRRTQGSFNILQVVYLAKMIITIIVSLASIAVATTVVIMVVLQKAVFLRISILYTVAVIVLYSMSFSSNFVLSMMEADFCYALAKTAEGQYESRQYVAPFISCLDGGDLDTLFTGTSESIQLYLNAIYKSAGQDATAYDQYILDLSDILEVMRTFVDCTNGDPQFINNVLLTLCVSNIDVSVASWLSYIVATGLAILLLIALLMARPFFVLQKNKKFIDASKLADPPKARKPVMNREGSVHLDMPSTREKRNSSIFNRGFLTKPRSTSVDLEEPLVVSD